MFFQEWMSGAVAMQQARKVCSAVDAEIERRRRPGAGCVDSGSAAFRQITLGLFQELASQTTR